MTPSQTFVFTIGRSPKNRGADRLPVGWGRSHSRYNPTPPVAGLTWGNQSWGTLWGQPAFSRRALHSRLGRYSCVSLNPGPPPIADVSKMLADGLAVR